MIKLFDIENNTVKPTAHCQIIKWLRVIQEKFPDKALKIYAYVFYMSYHGEENPYFNLQEDIKEDCIIHDLDIDFSLEEDEIIEAVEKATQLYETPTMRAHKSISTLLDRIATFMGTATITTGRDGNLTALAKVAKDFEDIRQSYKGISRDLAEEQAHQVRGGQDLAYDQQ